jgi:hypothetical protein
MTNNYSEDKKQAFLNKDNKVDAILVFNDGPYEDSYLQGFADQYGFSKAICCETYGTPYVGDTWDETNKNWIEDSPARFPSVENNEIEEIIGE